MSSKILLVGDYNYNDQQVLRKVVINIQKSLDIEPNLIKEWLNMEDFGKSLLELNRECYRKVMSEKNKLLEKLLNVSHRDSFVTEYLFWEKEKCGQILDEFSNGYIKYCNKHKYLHNNKDGLSTKKVDDKIDHYFITKNTNEIIEEQLFKIRFNLYLNITRLLAQKLENKFYQYLNSLGYQEFYCPINDQLENVIIWLRNNNNSFKSKYIIYEKDLNEIKRMAMKKNKLKTNNLDRAKGKIKKKKKNNETVKNDDIMTEKNSNQGYLKIYIHESVKEKDYPKIKLISSNML